MPMSYANMMVVVVDGTTLKMARKPEKITDNKHYVRKKVSRVASVR